VSDVVDESVAHKTPVQDFAADWDHTDPQWVNDPYRSGRPARTLPGRPHRTLRRRLVPDHARDGDLDRQ